MFLGLILVLFELSWSVWVSNKVQGVQVQVLLGVIKVLFQLGIGMSLLFKEL